MQNQCLSLNQLSIEAQTGCEVHISKQGLDQRMNEYAVDFLSRLLQKQMADQIFQNLEIGLLQKFNRVRVKDSTKFDIHEQLREWLPGFGGCSSDASACIQYEFDLKSGQVIDLSLTPGNSSDTKDALAKSENIISGDLIIRDLGYFALDVLKKIQKEEACFLSRLNAKTIVYEQLGAMMTELDFGKLYRVMSQNGIHRMEKQVFVGKEERLPARLIIELMPDHVYEQRIRKIKKYNHRKGHKTSTEFLDRSRFNLFITNATEDLLSATTIPLLYKVRWQIELTFKAWKSIYGIQATRKMKFERFLCQLLSKLLIIMINWEIIQTYRNRIYLTEGRLLSIDKCFKTLKSNAGKFRDLLNKPECCADQLIQWISMIFASKHWLEKRKNKICYEEIISILH